MAKSRKTTEQKVKELYEQIQRRDELVEWAAQALAMDSEEVRCHGATIANVTVSVDIVSELNITGLTEAQLKAVLAAINATAVR